MEELKKKIQDEIAALEHELRTELPKQILTARAHGDLSENAEYHAAKERQGLVNARLGQLQARLREFSMIDMTKIPRDRVGLGSRVVVLDLNKDEELSYNLVTSEDADVAHGRISTSSPIRKRLLGNRVGDTDRIQIPDGTITRAAYVVLTAVVMTASVMISYARTRAENIIPTCKVGFMERPVRVVLLIIGALFLRLAPVLWVLAVLGNLTVVHRMIFTYQESARLEEAQLRARVASAASGRAV